MSQELAFLPMTRTHFCPRCKALGYPRNLTIYVVFGHDHCCLDTRLHAPLVPKKNLGFTPHIFMEDYCYIPYTKKEGGYFVIRGLCGVLGCGFTVSENGDYLRLKRDPELFRFDAMSFRSIISFKDPEFYLEESDPSNWDTEKILEEQLAIFG